MDIFDIFTQFLAFWANFWGIAFLERLFSSYGWIHDGQGNRLGNGKASKLLFVWDF